MTGWPYDAILRECHARGMNDAVTTRYMLDLELPVTSFDVAAARRRLGLSPNRGHVRLVLAEPPPPKGRVNPMVFARAMLGDRLVEKATGYWLDGAPARLDTIMQAANRVAIEQGLEPVLACERWRP